LSGCDEDPAVERRTPGGKESCKSFGAATPATVEPENARQQGLLRACCGRMIANVREKKITFLVTTAELEALGLSLSEYEEAQKVRLMTRFPDAEVFWKMLEGEADSSNSVHIDLENALLSGDLRRKEDDQGAVPSSETHKEKAKGGSAQSFGGFKKGFFDTK
jgi:hypothetical protein